MTRVLIERLPNLKLIASTGPRNAAIDLAAAADHGIGVVHTRYESTATIEFTWAMILGLARKIWIENASLRAGGWQSSVGFDLQGKTLGLLGLGNIGSRVAEIAKVFGMNVLAWSQNLTQEKATQYGAKLVSKQDLFEQSDVISIHVILSDRTRNLVGAPELELMEPSALLINTSRGPIVDETALITALQENKIAGAAIDVFEQEPLPLEHAFRKLKNVLATPHIGYSSESLYEIFYKDTVSNIDAWIKSKNL
jgi:phosphoglycerate dehydrogenase-like enzyme